MDDDPGQVRHGEPVDHPILSVLHEIGDDGATALATTSPEVQFLELA